MSPRKFAQLFRVICLENRAYPYSCLNEALLIVYFAVSWYRSNFLFVAVNVNRMVAALAEFFAAMSLQMADQIAEFHAAFSRNGSRITSPPLIDSSAS